MNMEGNLQPSLISEIADIVATINGKNQALNEFFRNSMSKIMQLLQTQIKIEAQQAKRDVENNNRCEIVVVDVEQHDTNSRDGNTISKHCVDLVIGDSSKDFSNHVPFVNKVPSVLHFNQINDSGCKCYYSWLVVEGAEIDAYDNFFQQEFSRYEELDNDVNYLHRKAEAIRRRRVFDPGKF